MRAYFNQDNTNISIPAYRVQVSPMY